MKRIVIYESGNPTPQRNWDYVAHFDGDCQGQEHGDPFGRGKNPEEALKDFLETLEN